jgi:hypothetical protein
MPRSTLSLATLAVTLVAGLSTSMPSSPLRVAMLARSSVPVAAGSTRMPSRASISLTKLAGGLLSLVRHAALRVLGSLRSGLVSQPRRSRKPGQAGLKRSYSSNSPSPRAQEVA